MKSFTFATAFAVVLSSAKAQVTPEDDLTCAVFQATNAYRRAATEVVNDRTLNELQYHAGLSEVAAIRCDTLASTGNFAHDRAQVEEECQGRCPGVVLENIAFYASTAGKDAATIMDSYYAGGWLDDDGHEGGVNGHRKQFDEPRWVSTGAAVCSTFSDGFNRWYAVQLFSREDQSSVNQCTAPQDIPDLIVTIDGEQYDPGFAGFESSPLGFDTPPATPPGGSTSGEPSGPGDEPSESSTTSTPSQTEPEPTPTDGEPSSSSETPATTETVKPSTPTAPVTPIETADPTSTNTMTMRPPTATPTRIPQAPSDHCDQEWDEWCDEAYGPEHDPHHSYHETSRLAKQVKQIERLWELYYNGQMEEYQKLMDQMTNERLQFQW